MTEMRKPQQALETAGDEAVAILRKSKLVGHFVSAEAVAIEQVREASHDERLLSLNNRRDVTRPVVEYLKDK